MHRFTRLLGTAAMLCTVATLSACGGDDGGGSADATPATSGAPAADSSAGVAKAKAAVAELSKPPGPIELPTLSKTPPRGKTVALVTCPVPGCKLAESSVGPAAKLLGWNVKVLDGGLSPEKYVAAMDQALQLKPDYIILTALQPNATIKTQLEQAESRGIPVDSFGSSDPPGGAMKATIFGQNTVKSMGAGLAQWVTADSEGKAKVVYLRDPSAATWKLADARFDETIGELCPGCEIDTLQVSDLDIGKDIPQQVVSYLQKNPDTEYVMTSTSTRFLGVTAALNGAGLSKVRLGSATGIPTDFALTKADSPPYTILAAEQLGGYRAIDVFARLSVGDDIEDCCTDPTLYQQLLTKENIDSFDNTRAWSVPDIAKTFAGYWKVDIPAGFKDVDGVGGG